MRIPNPVSDRDPTAADQNIVGSTSPAIKVPQNPKTGALRVGVIGCGYWGSNYIRILSSINIRELVVVECRNQGLEKIAFEFPGIRPHSKLESALPHVDSLIIATPPVSHGDLAVRCLNHGKHVLVEKPMALSTAEAVAMIRTAERAQRQLMIGHTFEFNGGIRDLKQQIVSGELGQITHIHSARFKGPYRSDISVVWDMVPHDISIMNYLLASKPCIVTASASFNTNGIADTVYAKLDYSDVGVICQIDSSWLAYKKVRDITVIGTKKVAVHDDTSKGPLHLFDRRSNGKHHSEDSAIVNRSPEPLLVQINHFLSCVSEGTKPVTGGKNGLAVVAVLEAIDQSIVAKAPVRVHYPNDSEL
jgi:predicted dehydrogenase